MRQRINTVIGSMLFTVCLTLAIASALRSGRSLTAAIVFACLAGLFLGLTLADLRRSDR